LLRGKNRTTLYVTKFSVYLFNAALSEVMIVLHYIKTAKCLLNCRQGVIVIKGFLFCHRLKQNKPNICPSKYFHDSLIFAGKTRASTPLGITTLCLPKFSKTTPDKKTFSITTLYITIPTYQNGTQHNDTHTNAIQNRTQQNDTHRINTLYNHAYQNGSQHNDI